ncbi:MAG TPA: hypothetical protein VFI02_05875 [Armatimonadota bacterium]|nr:hypothetical protein [Armatimonadota bacterium]
MNRQYRTDRHRNPVAFTTAIAQQAGLVRDVDYSIGDAFADGKFYTARLLGEPVTLTIRVIDAIGFYTQQGRQRWDYIGIPQWLWASSIDDQKRRVIGFMYQHEGGTEMRGLFDDPKSHPERTAVAL